MVQLNGSTLVDYIFRTTKFKEHVYLNLALFFFKQDKNYHQLVKKLTSSQIKTPFNGIMRLPSILIFLQRFDFVYYNCRIHENISLSTGNFINLLVQFFAFFLGSFFLFHLVFSYYVSVQIVQVIMMIVMRKYGRDNTL
ncbi:hypothetical protein BpHYR1_027348 [Brachionus plicatilis]|uniref:Uncharacterized protein n=1 Tax=Brachionus plicatilis TaxID=10195 RepID=A0A3M7PXB0_BRAPC|nr:hypothetical protein BpHYR1_027348 [Brachionus plicatilis]